MADEKQLEILKQGVEVWNKWRGENPDIKIDLSETDFSDAYLSRADFRDADLRDADLRDADLSGADLRRVNLRRVNLGSANLSGANLNSADLSGADLFDANLRDAKLRKADLSSARLVDARLKSADLSGADLRQASLIGTNLTSAVLTDCVVYGISAWDLKLEGTQQSNLVITRHDEPTIMVDDLEVAQFIYLLLNREKLRDVLNTMTKKGVLILGRFKEGGLKVLQAVAEEVREKGYLPILFDFDKCDSLNFTQTVKIMVGFSRFVIANLSGPSVLKELEATVPFYDVPIIPIIEKGRDFPSMIIDLTIYPWFRWPPFKFSSKETLVEMLPKSVIAPAEKIGKKRQERRAILFPG